MNTGRSQSNPPDGTGEGRKNGASARVVILGFDSADPDLILAWAREGLLPNFARLLQVSAWGRIENPAGLVAGAVWQTFQTGVWPGRHGQYNATKHFDPATYEDNVYLDESDLPCPHIWELASRAGHRVAVIDAPYVFLAEGLNGIHIHEWGSHERRVPKHGPPRLRTWPAGLEAEVLSTYGSDPLGMHELLCDAFKPRNRRELIPFRDALLRRVEIKTQMTLDFLRREPWAYFESTYFAAHCVGHQCWHYHDPTHPRYDPDEARSLGDPLLNVYVALDGALGRVLDAVDPQCTFVAYCSHGIGPNYTATGGTLDKILLALEGLETPVGVQRAVGTARRLWRSAPGPLRKLLVPLNARKLEAAFWKRVEPSKSARKFFEVQGNGACGAIRINLRGREAEGKVEPGAEYEALCESLTRDLLDVVNADSGQPLVTRVLRAQEMYPGPYADRMPDLLVEWNREHPIVRVSSPKIGTLADPNPSMRSGDHRPVGLFAARGPHVRWGELPAAVSVVDFAPTVAALLGLSDVDFDGHPIEALLERERKELSPNAAG